MSAVRPFNLSINVHLPINRIMNESAASVQGNNHYIGQAYPICSRSTLIPINSRISLKGAFCELPKKMTAKPLCGKHHIRSFLTVILFFLQQISIHIENGPLEGLVCIAKRHRKGLSPTPAIPSSGCDVTGHRGFSTQDRLLKA